MRRSTMMLGVLAGMAAGEASASGGFSCTVDDVDVRLQVDAAVTRGMGGPVYEFAARTEIRGSGVAPDLAHTDFATAHLAQYWNSDGELKFVLYREREAESTHGYVEATIRARVGEEGEAAGRYEVSSFDVGRDGAQKETRAEGEVSCFVE